MRFVDEFRDGRLIRLALDEIRQLADVPRRFRIMEVCGGHTHAIFRFGLHELLPRNVELIHGPGCPVCILPKQRLDEGLSLAESPDVIFSSFGDVLRVPGSQGSPQELRARGRDIRMVYSPLDALDLARKEPERRVLFFAIGFETTAPATALTLRRAREEGVNNFFVYCNHVLIIPALRALLESPGVAIDGFIGPGHVSTVIGCRPYEFVAREFGRPLVVSGFEPADIVQSLLLVLRQLRVGESRVENQYGRAVTWDGNRLAQELLAEVFVERASFPWRGMGPIARSAVGIAPDYAAWDAERTLSQSVGKEQPARSFNDNATDDAPCGEVLTGRLEPAACPLFGTACTPEHPVGALMVSSEGACAARYRYATAVSAAHS